MEYFVYILQSLVNGDIYVGSTNNVTKRMRFHNAGKVKSTKGYCPWKLLAQEEYRTRGEAVVREYFLKTGQQKEMLREKYLRPGGEVG